jgi:chorismate mutase/prephenate dehydratase
MTDSRDTRPPPRDLGQLRALIDDIDARILALLNQRAAIASEVGEFKRASQPGGAFHAPAREREVLARLEAANTGPFPPEAIRAVFQEIMSACLSLERPLRVAFLGPEGAFSHQAVKHQFGLSAHPLAQRAIDAVFHAVEAHQADYGVVPVENATEGVIDATLDAFLESPLRIVGEILLPLELALLVHHGVEPAKVLRVYGQSESFRHVDGWLTAQLASASRVVASSAVEAARLAREDLDGAAVAPDVVAKLFDLEVAAQNIQDANSDATRFWVLGEKSPAPTGRDRTSLVVSVKNSPGVLLRVLDPLARRGIDLSRIESRRARKRVAEYVFFLDLDGHEQDGRVREALAEVEQVSAGLKLLGSYPKAEEIRR